MANYSFSGNAGQSIAFDPAQDVLVFSAEDGSAAQLVFTVSGSDLVVSLGGASTVTLTGVSFSQLANTNLSFADGSQFLVGTDSDDSLTGGDFNDFLSGGLGGDLLDGDAGADSMTGGLGDDSYVISEAGDAVTENADEGVDTVQSAISYTLGDNLENLTLTGGVAVNAIGNAANNVLTGNGIGNLLDGGAGADTMAGAGGNDTYVVDNVSDVVSEAATPGTDLVRASIDYTLGDNLENLTLTGTATSGAGNTLNNTLTGNASDNLLDGLAGADAMFGGAGNDTYVLDNVGDSVTESADEGTDLVQSSVAFTLVNNVENLTLTGSADINGQGNILANTMTGNSGANRLNGLGGADTFIGGDGNDTYVVDNSGDIVVENADEGVDLVQATSSYTLSDNVENLTLSSALNTNATGNGGANVLTGNGGTNLLDGGAGADTMVGGSGNDTYVVDDVGDVVSEASSTGGTDLVRSSINYTLGDNVENLTLIGTAISGTGNVLVNVLTGNGENNQLDGGAGADSMKGGAGNDTYIVDNSSDKVTEAADEGTDLVLASASFTLSDNVENLTLTGALAIDGTGNAAANVLSGNDNNNLLDGGAGADSMAGALGNDTYVVDNTGDSITENASADVDLVRSFINYTLGGNLENLTLVGSAVVNGTGNDGANVLTGNAAANLLDGGAGADSMAGGASSDTYVVDNLGDVVTEAADAGTDLVRSSIDYTLGANLENLTLTDSAVSGAGNELANTLTGNDGNNLLDGGTGADSLIGGLGNDTYMVDNASDAITENADQGVDLAQSSVSYTLSANVENLTLSGTAINGFGNELANTITGNSGNNLLDGGAGADTLIGDAGDDTYVVDNAGDTVTESANAGIDLVKSSVSFTLGANLENLMLIGSNAISGVGNELANVLTGNSSNNWLNGGVGADTMAGAGGNDTYVVDNEGDVVSETSNAGVDLVRSSIDYTLGGNLENLTLIGSALDGFGNELANRLTGNANDNLLDGLAGVDAMIGAGGNDTYVVDNVSDTVTENADAGTDLVQSSVTYTLSANVENLTLSGSSNINGIGNGVANVLTGNSGNNVLNGGAGADTLVGGEGNDTYVVDNLSDTVTESADAGTDLVKSSVSYTLGANQENLTLTGTVAINGTGNDVANVLTGNGVANRLNGGVGADTMAGGAGNDTYVVDDLGDTVTELANGGTDVVLSAVDFTLGAAIENLTLTGTAVNGTGNFLSNRIVGNDLGNRLNGGAAADTLIGGQGDDTYVVDNTSDAITENADEGADLVLSTATYTLSANVENLTLTGSSAINGMGNGLANVLTGNSGANLLNGGAGADTLIGGGGNDTYVVDNAGDVLVENADQGIDLVKSSVNFTLDDNFENLTLTGSQAINGFGNAAGNVLTGNGAANLLNGGAGADTMAGGYSNDTYVVDNAGDIVTEVANAGTDLVRSSISYALTANVENLTLLGSDAINGTGNALNNVLTGNGVANRLQGGGGVDTLVGNGGADVFVYVSVSDTGLGTLRDVISDFNAGQGDKIDLSAIDARASTAEDNAFTFIGTAAFSADATGQLRFENGVLYGSTNADTTAEFSIQLTGVPSLQEASLVL